MSNTYIKYLCSLNNANSDNQNALAESQVQSEYYSKIVIDREIGDKIFDMLMKDREAIILTGHAGDGKTSILVQILKKLGYFERGRSSLQIEDEYRNIFYVKDMSESNEGKQEQLLHKFLNSPQAGKSAIIVSNTGPLINTFKRITKNENESADIESQLLKGISDIISDPIEIVVNHEMKKFRLVNIANIDNTYLSKLILDNILGDNLWKYCTSCMFNSQCPIFYNYCELKERKEIVKERISRIYFELAQAGHRLTIRQMFSHISYSVTSNLKCVDIQGYSDDKRVKFKYSFANRFFGYDDVKYVLEAQNISAINILNSRKIYEKSLGAIDNRLFVKEDFDMFTDRTSGVLKNMSKIYNNDMEIGNDTGVYYRRAIRRHLILLGNLTNDSLESMQMRLHSPAFNYYYIAIQEKDISYILKKIFKDVVFKALYRLFIGVFPDEAEDKLYITLRKNFFDIQQVQLILAKIDKDHIDIIHKPVNEIFENTIVKSKLEIKFGDYRFNLEYDFWIFLYRVSEGEIFTSLHPSFTFGLNKLKTSLINKFKVKSEEISIIVIESNQIKKIKLNIEDENIYVD